MGNEYKKKVLLKYLKFKILNKLDKKATPHPQILRYPQKLNVKYFKFRNKITKYNPKNLKMVKKLDKNVHDFLGRILKNKTEQKGLNLLGFFQNKKELNKKWAFFEKNTKDSTDSEHSHGSETSLRESYTPETPIQENCSPKAEITPETSTEEGHIAQVFTPEERELWEKHKLTREISAIFKKRYGSSLIVWNPWNFSNQVKISWIKNYNEYWAAWYNKYKRNPNAERIAPTLIESIRMALKSGKIKLIILGGYIPETEKQLVRKWAKKARKRIYKNIIRVVGKELKRIIKSGVLEIVFPEKLPIPEEFLNNLASLGVKPQIRKLSKWKVFEEYDNLAMAKYVEDNKTTIIKLPVWFLEEWEKRAIVECQKLSLKDKIFLTKEKAESALWGVLARGGFDCGNENQEKNILKPAIYQINKKQKKLKEVPTLNLEYEKFYNNVIMCTVWVLYLTLIAFEPKNSVPVGVKTDAFLKKAVPVMRTMYNLIKLKGSKVIKKKNLFEELVLIFIS